MLHTFLIIHLISFLCIKFPAQVILYLLDASHLYIRPPLLHHRSVFLFVPLSHLQLSYKSFFLTQFYFRLWTEPPCTCLPGTRALHRPRSTRRRPRRLMSPPRRSSPRWRTPLPPPAPPLWPMCPTATRRLRSRARCYLLSKRYVFAKKCVLL